jgi:hypothetical protein
MFQQQPRSQGVSILTKFDFLDTCLLGFSVFERICEKRIKSQPVNLIAFLEP